MALEIYRWIIFFLPIAAVHRVSKKKYMFFIVESLRFRGAVDV